MRRYCDYCHDEEDVKIIDKDEVYPVYGDEIPVKAQVMVCVHCGNELYSRELDSQTLKKVYDIYRRKHKPPSPNESKQSAGNIVRMKGEIPNDYVSNVYS